MPAYFHLPSNSNSPKNWRDWVNVLVATGSFLAGVAALWLGCQSLKLQRQANELAKNDSMQQVQLDTLADIAKQNRLINANIVGLLKATENERQEIIENNAPNLAVSDIQIDTSSRKYPEIRMKVGNVGNRDAAGVEIKLWFFHDLTKPPVLCFNSLRFRDLFEVIKANEQNREIAFGFDSSHYRASYFCFVQIRYVDIKTETEYVIGPFRHLVVNKNTTGNPSFQGDDEYYMNKIDLGRWSIEPPNDYKQKTYKISQTLKKRI